MTPDEQHALVARLRSIRGHLQVAGRLVHEGRSLQAAVQLRAVRGAIASLTAVLCRVYMRDAASGGAPGDEVRLAAVIRSGTRRTYRFRLRTHPR